MEEQEKKAAFNAQEAPRFAEQLQSTEGGKQEPLLLKSKPEWWLIEIWKEKREVFKAFIEHALLFAFPIGILVLFHYLFEIIPLSPERKHILDTIDFVGIMAALVIFQVSFIMKIFVLALRRRKNGNH